MNVIFEELPCADGSRLGLAPLDSPRNLNALSLEMVEALDARLRAWQADPQIACVLLRGAGEKAFCAGGDVRRIVEAQREPGEIPQVARDFFAAEYRLDHLIHRYAKPLICWARGHVMGGGMGLMQGASVRIVTPDSRLSMPEVLIGLYPDAGGSHFLSRLPAPLGLFLGLTASVLNAADALAFGLADRLLRSDQQPALIEALQALDWRRDGLHQLHAQLQRLAAEAADATPPAAWPAHLPLLRELLDVPDLPAAWQAVADLEGHTDPLRAAAADNLRKGSVLTAWLVWEQLRRARHQSLADNLRMEYAMSLACCRHGEFSEGVRARLIEKRPAHWRYRDVNSVPAELVAAHFIPAWDGAHPLADLN